MMVNEYGALLPKLKICLGQIQQIFEEGEKVYLEKVVKLEEEKAALYNLLQHRNELEKEHAELKAENFSLKEKISSLHVSSDEAKSKLQDLEKNYESYRKHAARKFSNWNHFINTVQKKCSCKFKDSGRKTRTTLYTPTIHIKRVSNLFFKSHKKRKGEYNYAANSEDSATPVIVGVKEKSSCLYFETDSSGNESDDEWLSTPSLFTDSDISMMTETPKSCKPQEFDIRNEQSNQIHSSETSPSGLLPCLQNPTESEFHNDHQAVKDDHSNLSVISSFKQNEEMLVDVTSESNLVFKAKNSVTSDEQHDSNKAIVMESSTGKERIKNYRNVFMPNRKVVEISQSIRKKSKTLKIVPVNNDETACEDQAVSSKHRLGYVLKSGGKESGNVSKPKSTNVKYEPCTVLKEEYEKSLGNLCDLCRYSYENQNVSEKELKEIVKQCADHKHLPSPVPFTPDNCWTLDFSPIGSYVEEG